MRGLSVVYIFFVLRISTPDRSYLFFFFLIKDRSYLKWAVFGLTFW